MTVVEIKQQNAQKSVMKGKLKFESYKNCLEETQLENKINHLENNKIYKDSFFCYKRKIIPEKQKLISKTQQRFKGERHNFFSIKMSYKSYN